MFPIEGTLAVIEVKSRLNSDEIASALENIASAKKLRSKMTTVNWQVPKTVQYGQEIYKLSEMPSPLGIVFAFESDINSETVLTHWQKWNSQNRNPQIWTDIICLLQDREQNSKGVLMIDTRRFSRLWDDIQIATHDPLASCKVTPSLVDNEIDANYAKLEAKFWDATLKPTKRKNEKLVALRTSDILFYLFSLILRDLRKMAAFTKELDVTTPIQYLREAEWPETFCLSNGYSTTHA